MIKITENSIEDLAISCLEQQGYSYIYAPEIAPDGDKPERESYEDVLLAGRLAEAVSRINPDLSYESQQEAIKEVQRIDSPELLVNNESFHRVLTEGKRYLPEIQKLATDTLRKVNFQLNN